MTAVNLVDATGKKAGSVDLPEAIFDAQTNVPLIHQVVVAQQAAARQGSHSTLRRGEVSGSGRKPFKQKGTGRARQGSIRAPQMTGGGIVHGPKPRDYSQRTNKKMIAAAVRGALSDRARAGRIHVVTEFGINDKPSTKQASAVINQLAKGRKTLVVIDRSDELSYLSLRNLKNLHVLPADQINAYDVLASDDLIFTAAALEAFVTAKSEVQA